MQHYLEDPAFVDVVLEGEGLQHGTNGVGVGHSTSHGCSKGDFSEKGEKNENLTGSKVFKRKAFRKLKISVESHVLHKQLPLS